VCINFFIGTVNLQISNVSLTKAFAIMLPAGGIVYIPLVGAITDGLQLHQAWMVMWCSILSFSVLIGLYTATAYSASAVCAFALFSFCRPLLYTLAAASTGRIFGFETFGTVYGVLFSLAGVANMSVQPLTSLAQAYGFTKVNALVVCLTVAALLLPCILCRKRAASAPTQSRAESCSPKPAEQIPAFSPVLHRMAAGTPNSHRRRLGGELELDGP